MAYSLKDKVVIITGAASGIGAEVVKLLTKEEVKHVAVFDVAEDTGNALRDELNAKIGSKKVSFFKVDVSNENNLLDAFKSVKTSQGYIDVVINNAGIMVDSIPIYKKEIEINFIALVTSTLKSLEIMRSDEGGRGGTVINVSSIAALLQDPFLPVYYGTKAAVLQFSNCIGLEEYYKRTGVRVLTICFGGTDSALLSKQKLKSFDPYLTEGVTKRIQELKLQSTETAAQGVVDMYKRGESGSTWLVFNGKPARDITGEVKKAYKILSSVMED